MSNTNKHPKTKAPLSDPDLIDAPDMLMYSDEADDWLDVDEDQCAFSMSGQSVFDGVSEPKSDRHRRRRP